MSFTFSQPGSPTAGLQNYSIERGVKNLAPNTALISLLRRRAASRRKSPLPRDGKHRKEKSMAQAELVKSMIGTLQTSVTSILASASDNRDDLLQKTFDEFGDALGKVVGDVEQGVSALQAKIGEMQKLAPFEEPLYKGMGTVGRIAGLAEHVARRLKCINDGKDYDGQDTSDDQPSEETQAFLEHAIAALELALRQSVNEHVSIADDDSTLGDGDSFGVLKMADGTEQRIISKLPDELTKLACDPILIDQALIEQATDVLMAVGVPEKALAKLFAGDNTLAKAFPPKQGDSGGDAGGDGGGDAGGDAGDGGTDDGTGGADGSDLSGADPVEMLNIMGRLAAAMMVQTDGLLRLFEGAGGDDGSGGADAGGGDPGAAQIQSAGGTGGGSGASGGGSDTSGGGSSGGGSDDGSDDPKKKPPGLNKLADPRVDALQKQVGDLSAMLQKVLKSPLPAKGALGDYADGLTKVADTGGADPINEQKLGEALEKLAPQRRAEVAYMISRGTDPRQIHDLAKFMG